MTDTLFKEVHYTLGGLSYDELRHIFNLADVGGEGYPPETSHLQNNVIRQYGECRTRRLVLEAWDRLDNVPST